MSPNHLINWTGYCLEMHETHYGMKGRTFWDCTRFIMACVGEGPEVEKGRDEGSFGMKKHGKVERKGDKRVWTGLISVLAGPCPALDQHGLSCLLTDLLFWLFPVCPLCVYVEVQCQTWVWDHRSWGCAPGCQQLERPGCLHTVWVHMSVCAVASKHQAGLVASRKRGLRAMYLSGPKSGLDAIKIRVSTSQLLEMT